MNTQLPFPLQYDGNPNGVLKAPIHWLCRDLSGGVDGGYYIKTTSEASSTGWVAWSSVASLVAAEASASEAIAEAINPALDGECVISGTPTEDEELACAVTFTKASSTTYQWQMSEDGVTDWENIEASATGATFILTAAEVDLYIRCVATGVNVIATSGESSNVLGPVEAAA